jgi:hypothetical protein
MSLGDVITWYLEVVDSMSALHDDSKLGSGNARRLPYTGIAVG